MVTASALTIIGSMGMVALQSAKTSANVARAKSEAASEARAVVSSLAAELELAQKNPHSGDAIDIVQAPFDGCVMEFSFTIPGASALRPRHIRYQFLSEDANANQRFDSGEDTLVADNRLSGRILRIETVDNAEGEPIEVPTIVGGAHDIRELSLDFRDNLLKIVATSAKPIGTTHNIDSNTGRPVAETIESTSVARVYLMN